MMQKCTSCVEERYSCQTRGFRLNLEVEDKEMAYQQQFTRFPILDPNVCGVVLSLMHVKPSEEGAGNLNIPQTMGRR